MKTGVAAAVAATLILAGCFGPSEEEKREALVREQARQVQKESERAEAVIKEQRRQTRIEEDKIKALIEKAVRDRLKDPASAQFGLVTMITPVHACAGVNAKNAFGGYTGEKQAFVTRVDGNWYAIAIEEMSHLRCIEITKTFKD